MRIAVTVKTRAKQDKAEKLDDGSYKVYTKSPPVDGKANESVCGILSGFFGVSMSRVIIVRGKNSKKKFVDIIFN